MTGPEHYTEAQRLLTKALDEDEGTDAERYFLGAAQVHATLALAAATASAGQIFGEAAQAWDKATGADR